VSPIVVVSRDVSRDPLRIEWFEDEAGYYARDPLAWVEFHRARDTWKGHASRNAPPEIALAASRILLDLSCDTEVSVSHLATHYVSEPGAPLEPIPPRGKAA
jgi:hypothetical protein